MDFSSASTWGAHLMAFYGWNLIRLSRLSVVDVSDEQMQVLAEMNGEDFYIAIVYHEWFMVAFLN